MITITFNSQFLKIPDKTNLVYRPSYPYKFSHDGFIHSGKIEELLNEFLRDFEVKRENLKKIAGSHSINEIFNLSNEEIADFFRHFLYLNKNEIGWDLFDEILNQLDLHYKALWEYPGQQINLHFSEVLNQLIDWPLSDSDNSRIQEFFKEKQPSESSIFLYKAENIMVNTGQAERQTIETLSFYLELLIFYSNQHWEANFQLNDVIQRLEFHFENLIQRTRDPIQNLTMELIYLKIILGKPDIYLENAQEVLFRIWRKLDNLDDVQQVEYTWIFGLFKSIFTLKLLFYENNLHNRRLLVYDLIENYFDTSQFNLSLWTSYAMRIKFHPRLFSYLCEGFHHFIKTLEEIIAETMDVEEHERLVKIYNSQNKNLSSFMLRYISHTTFESKEEDILDLEHISYIDDLLPLPSQVQNIKEILFFSLKHQLITANEWTNKENLMLVYTSQLISGFISEEYQYFFQLDLMLTFDDLPFEQIGNQILKESDEIGSLFTPTFENEIIKSFSRMYEFVMKNEHYTSWQKFYCMEILFWYISEWLILLSSYPSIEYEAVLLISPFVTAIMVIMAKQYFGNNAKSKGYLMLLNDHYFSIVVRTIINPDMDHKLLPKVAQIMHRNQEIYEEIEVLLSQSYSSMKELSLSTRDLVKRKNVSLIASQVSENLVNNILNLRDELVSFLELSENLSYKEIIKEIHRSGPYVPPDPKSIYILQKIGKCNASETLLKLPFPVIRNLSAYSLAIHQFPIEFTLSSFGIDIKLS